MKNFIYITKCFLYVVIVLTSTSCSKYTYLLNTPNVPLFEKKKQLNVGGYLQVRGAEGQLAYSVTDHLALQTSSMIGIENQLYNEMLAGYFFNKKNLCFELYSGAGFGKLEYSKRVQDGFYTNAQNINVNTNYLKIPLQLNIGFLPSKDQQIFCTGKLSFIHYDKFDYYYQNLRYNKPGYSTLNFDSIITENLSGFILDLGIGFNLGLCSFQVGTSMKNFPEVFHGEKSVKPLDHPFYTPLYISFGLKFRDIIGKIQRHENCN